MNQRKRIAALEDESFHELIIREQGDQYETPDFVEIDRHLLSLQVGSGELPTAKQSFNRPQAVRRQLPTLAYPLLDQC